MTEELQYKSAKAMSEEIRPKVMENYRSKTLVIAWQLTIMRLEIDGIAG
jgi:hypothetical protein